MFCQKSKNILGFWSAVFFNYYDHFVRTKTKILKLTLFFTYFRKQYGIWKFYIQNSLHNGYIQFSIASTEIPQTSWQTFLRDVSVSRIGRRQFNEVDQTWFSELPWYFQTWSTDTCFDPTLSTNLLMHSRVNYSYKTGRQTWSAEINFYYTELIFQAHISLAKKSVAKN